MKKYIFSFFIFNIVSAALNAANIPPKTQLKKLTPLDRYMIQAATCYAIASSTQNIKTDSTKDAFNRMGSSKIAYFTSFNYITKNVTTYLMGPINDAPTTFIKKRALQALNHVERANLTDYDLPKEENESTEFSIGIAVDVNNKKNFCCKLELPILIFFDYVTQTPKKNIRKEIQQSIEFGVDTYLVRQASIGLILEKQ